MPLASATYNPSARTVTLLPQGSRKLPKYEQLTIRSGLLTDSLGRPIDEGHTVVVTVGKSGQVISQAAVSTTQAPSAAMVDALFAGELGLSPKTPRNGWGRGDPVAGKGWQNFAPHTVEYGRAVRAADHRLRLLAGQPEDQVVGVAVAGHRALIVPGSGLIRK